MHRFEVRFGAFRVSVFETVGSDGIVVVREYRRRHRSHRHLFENFPDARHHVETVADVHGVLNRLLVHFAAHFIAQCQQTAEGDVARVVVAHLEERQALEVVGSRFRGVVAGLRYRLREQFDGAHVVARFEIAAPGIVGRKPLLRGIARRGSKEGNGERNGEEESHGTAPLGA